MSGKWPRKKEAGWHSVPPGGRWYIGTPGGGKSFAYCYMSEETESMYPPFKNAWFKCIKDGKQTRDWKCIRDKGFASRLEIVATNSFDASKNTQTLLDNSWKARGPAPKKNAGQGNRGGP